jgi:hypothetical protein
VLRGSSPPATITGESAKAVIELKLWPCSRSRGSCDTLPVPGGPARSLRLPR